MSTLSTATAPARSSLEPLDRERFDAEWYLERYPDVRLSGIDPYNYHLNYGRNMGREARPLPRKIKRVVFVITDISSIGGVSNRTRLVLEYTANRTAAFHALTLNNAFGKQIDRAHSMADDPDLIRRLIAEWTPHDTVFILSNNMLRPFPEDVKDRIQQFPIVYFSAGQLAFFVQNSSILADMDYVDKFKAMRIVSLSDSDINFQRQLGIFGQVKGTVPVAQRKTNTYDLARNRRLGYVGRIDFHAKDCMKLLGVARAMQNSDLMPISIFTTDGSNSPGYQKFRTAISAAGLQDQFRFEVNCTDKERIFREIAFLLLPSKMEGFGNVVVEAFSFGIPVVATSYAPGPAETIEHGRSGFLLDEYSGPEVKRLLSGLGEEQRLEMSSHAFERHKRYSLEDHVALLEDICNAALTEFDGENRYQVFPRLSVLENLARKKK